MSPKIFFLKVPLNRLFCRGPENPRKPQYVLICNWAGISANECYEKMRQLKSQIYASLLATFTLFNFFGIAKVFN